MSKKSKREKREAKQKKAQEIVHVQEQTKLPGKWDSIEILCPMCETDNHVYMFDDKKTCYCLACDSEFDILESESATAEHTADYPTGHGYLSDEIAQVKAAIDKQGKPPITQMTLPGTGNTVVTGSSTDSTGTAYKNWRTCQHPPTLVIALENSGVWAGKKWDVEYHARHFDVVLNLTGDSIQEKHHIPIPELQHWENYNRANNQEIVLDWEDFSTVELPKKFWDELLDYIQSKQLRMVVFCQGGHGRTGTAVASMLVCLGWAAEDAIDWVRDNYCYEAIENKAQENYVIGIQKQAEAEAEQRKADKAKAAAAGE